MRYTNTGSFEFARKAAPSDKKTLLNGFVFDDPANLSANLPVVELTGALQVDSVAVMAYGKGKERHYYKIASANAHRIIPYRGDSQLLRYLLIPSITTYP